MRVLVIGGTGLAGSKPVGKLNGHEAVAAAPNTGVMHHVAVSAVGTELLQESRRSCRVLTRTSPLPGSQTGSRSSRSRRWPVSAGRCHPGTPAAVSPHR
ncbi:hypothetical protein B1C81_37625 [Streptomyces sp. HG99]|nr:hypothetical protein B1C81_37625 [Streptomyces sp. HG99]